jgi:hypothetical protein
MKNNLTITVTGKEKTGKTGLSLLLINFLKENDFDVEYVEEKYDESDIIFPKKIGKNIKHITNVVKKTTKITFLDK